MRKKHEKKNESNIRRRCLDQKWNRGNRKSALSVKLGVELGVAANRNSNSSNIIEKKKVRKSYKNFMLSQKCMK